VIEDLEQRSAAKFGFSDAEFKNLKAQNRVLRAWFYLRLLDAFRNIPLAVSYYDTSKNSPGQVEPRKVYDFIESELKAIESDLKAPKANVYGRADQATAWAPLSPPFLHAEVYTGPERCADAAAYAERVIASGKYSLHTNYDRLFLADNNLNNPEVLLSINYDGQRSQNWGGMTFLINSSTGGDAKKATGVNMGVNGGWNGNRATAGLLNLFGGNLATDKRALIKAVGSGEIKSVTEFNEGVYVYKFRNVTSTGANGSNGDHADTDFPLFRLAELYLNFAEAAVRGKADATKGLTYLNLVRARAYGAAVGNYSALPALTEILAERGREFYWEGQRRTDLIRFGKFTSGDYVWPWKAGVKEGKASDAYRQLYPIPAISYI